MTQPPGDTHRTVAARDQNQSNNKIGWDRWIELAFTFAILAATVVNVVVAKKQWSAMIESNRINNLALVEIQRASVLYNGMVVNQFSAGLTSLSPDIDSVAGQGIVVAPTWFNAGGSATKNLHVYFGRPIESISPIERPDMRIPKDVKWVPTVIGPKGSQNGASRGIAIDKIKAIRTGQYHIYLWGDAYYNDIFPGTAEHKTKFCQEISGVTTAIDAQKQETVIGLTLTACMIHNCIDNECDAQTQD